MHIFELFIYFYLLNENSALFCANALLVSFGYAAAMHGAGPARATITVEIGQSSAGLIVVVPAKESAVRTES